MIIHLQENVSVDNARKISSELEGKLIFNNENKLIITSSKTKSIDKKYEDFISEKFVLESDIQLSSKDYIKKTRKVKINNIEVGGETNNTLMITCLLYTSDAADDP